MFMAKKRQLPSSSKRRRNRRRKLDDEFLFLDPNDKSSLNKSELQESGDSDGSIPHKDDDSDSDAFDHETPDERRIRLAKEYIQKLESEHKPPTDGTESADDDDDDDDESDVDLVDDIIHARLQQDVLKKRGKHFRQIADEVKNEIGDVSLLKFETLRGHRLSVTCLILSVDQSVVYSGSKDGSIIEWDVKTCKKLHHFHCARKRENVEGHRDQVFALAVSSDGQYLASGGREHFVFLWDTKTRKLLYKFRGHRDSISALSFQHNASLLFSASLDRTVKLFNTDSKSYIDTLFGHESQITSMSVLLRDRVLTCGSDRTLRLYKIEAESQLVFRGAPQHRASLDCCASVTDERFLCGSQDGSLSLWNVNRKKAQFLVPNAHGGKWICSIAAQKFSDLFASGSSDGFVRLWKIESNTKFSEITAIPVCGFINSLQFSELGNRLYIGIGKEPRLGRWDRIGNARNCLKIIDLKKAQ
uniref:U3 small nucleolar RNA-interacting protein 2 isoform X2 n=2 Tax=Hirondellea gigas TaxID=1518452 RepID=A0A6A7G2W5_9CRUS